MWDMLKRKPDGAYLCEAAAEKARLLKGAHDALIGEYDGRLPQPVDFEIGSQKLWLNKRTKLQKYVRFAATLVEGLKFQRLGSQRTASSDISTCPQLVVSVKQMTQRQRRVITGMTQALLKANSSQLWRREEDEDIESSDQSCCWTYF